MLLERFLFGTRHRGTSHPQDSGSPCPCGVSPMQQEQPRVGCPAEGVSWQPSYGEATGLTCHRQGKDGDPGSHPGKRPVPTTSLSLAAC